MRYFFALTLLLALVSCDRAKKPSVQAGKPASSVVLDPCYWLTKSQAEKKSYYVYLNSNTGRVEGQVRESEPVMWQASVRGQDQGLFISQSPAKLQVEKHALESGICQTYAAAVKEEAKGR